MKKLLLSVLLSLMVMGVHAQKKTLKAAKKAFNKKEYAQAIDLATQASQNADTQDNAEIYKIIGVSIAHQFDGNLTDLSMAEKAYAAFLTAIEKGGDKMKEDLLEPPLFNAKNEFLGGGEGLGYLQALVNQQGNTYFEAEDFENAYKYYLLSYKIDEENIILAFYAGYSAYAGEMYDQALTHYAEVIALDKKLGEDEEHANTKFAYNGLIDIYLTQKEDYNKALTYIKEAQEKYPEEKLYKDYEIDVLIKSDRMGEAIDGLKQVVASGKATKQSYYTLAFLYWNNEDFEEALTAANEALGLDPDYYDALYVAGSVHYNQGVNFRKEANNTDDNAKYAELKQKALDKFKEAMPYFERAIAQNPDDTYSLNPLSTIYDQLDMDAKRDEILSKLEALGGE